MRLASSLNFTSVQWGQDMFGRMTKRRAIINALCVSACVAAIELPRSVSAQTANLLPLPVHKSIDDNGVDLFSGTISVYTPDVMIGASSENGLAFNRSYN